MKLEAKLSISTGVFIFAMFASALSVHLRIVHVLQVAQRVDGERQPFILAMQAMHAHAAESVIAVQSSLMDATDSDRRSASFAEGLEARKLIAADLDRIRSLEYSLDLGVDSNPMASLTHQVEELQRLEGEAEGLSDPTIIHTIITQQVLPLGRSIAAGIGSLIRSQTTIQNEEIALLQHADRAVLATLWAFTILSALIGGSISYIFARRLGNAVCAVADRANAIASGNLTGADLAVASQDQIGELELAMRKMQSSLASIIGTVVGTARTLTGNADSMHTASDLIHRRIDEQSQQTQQAATALQEMSASIAEVSRHAQSAADTARSAAQTAHEGGDIVKQMLASMSSIATAVSDTSNTVGLLGDDSKRISQIVTVIDEIARKTNLLALNAAIEAARAGEQGRGFAVVAGEVRRLAESTAQATSQISSMIRGIQERTHIAIASMASGTVTVGQGVITTNLAGEALERIIGMAERVDRMIAQIAIAATQQSVAANQSSASLHSIYSLSHENLCEMATTTEGIETLRTTALALEQHVVHFHVEEAPNGNNPRRTPTRSASATPRLVSA